jgi:hypothetical protein
MMNILSISDVAKITRKMPAKLITQNRKIVAF